MATVAVAVASVRPVDPAGLEAVGSAPPGAHVRLRLNNSVLAEVVAGADGEWRLTIERGLTAGDYLLEALAVDAGGATLARAEAPFVYPQREAVVSVAAAAPAVAPSSAPSAPSSAASPPASPAAAAPTPAASTSAAPTPAASTSVASTPAASTPVAAAEPSSPPTPAASSAASEPTPTATPAAPAPTASVAAEPAPSAPAPAQTPAASETPVATAAHAVVAEVLTYTVVRGDNLWDLAIKYYGDGLLYADIFSANASQIRNPNLIYIGQIFVVPPKPTTNPPVAR
jgi:nucleoid-associated protein YgaU